MNELTELNKLRLNLQLIKLKNKKILEKNIEIKENVEKLIKIDSDKVLNGV